MSLNAVSLKRLQGVHPHLVTLVKRASALSPVDFQITEGLRTPARQKELKAAGASTTLNSRHLRAPNGLGHAVDVVAMIGSRVSWEFPLYARIADAFKQASKELGTAVEWGGDWQSIKDGPHFQLPWKDYPGIAALGDPPPQQPTADDWRTLAIGAAGSVVMDLQRRLNAAGATLDIDGDFGPQTRAAVIAYQKRHAVVADGIVGADTWGLLNG